MSGEAKAERAVQTLRFAEYLLREEQRQGRDHEGERLGGEAKA